MRVWVLLAYFFLGVVEGSSKPYTHPEFPSKVSHDLRVAQHARLYSRANEVERDTSKLFRRDNEGRLLIGIVHDVLDENQRSELVAAIESLGGRVGAFATRVTDAYLTLNTLETLAKRPEIISILAHPPPITNTGSVTSQVVSTLDIGASLLDGTGITIGVMSDSVSKFKGGLSDSIGTGDLPPLARNTILKDGTWSFTDEARGMAEIIYDIAPGVDFLYYMPETPADFAVGIAALVNNGANVIVDDINFLTEPVYQDSVIAQAATAATAAGVVYVSSAGNSANAAYEAVFEATTSKVSFNFSSEISDRYCHKFSELLGDGRLDISSVIGSKRFTLHWTCPFFTLGGKSCGVDLDLIHADWSTSPPTVLDSALNVYSDPVEYLPFTATSKSSLSLCLKSSASASAANYNGTPVKMKLNYWSSISLYGLPGSPTVLGQKNIAGSIAVGALLYTDTCRGPYSTNSECGTTLPSSIYFSSLGGQAVWFDDDGDLLATPRTLLKPDVTAAQCGDTSFFGQLGFDSTPAPNFCGTSASAPAVAGVVALLLQGCPNLTPAQIASYITSTATNVFPTGFDYYAGFGQVDTQGALNAISAAGCPSASVSATLTISPSSSNSITPTSSASKTSTKSITSTPSQTSSRTGTHSISPALSGTPSGTFTPAPSSTRTVSRTLSGTPSDTISPALSGIPTPSTTITASVSSIVAASQSISTTVTRSLIASRLTTGSNSRSHSRSRSRSPSRSHSLSRSRSRASVTRTKSRTHSRTRSRSRYSPSRTRTRTPTRSHL